MAEYLGTQDGSGEFYQPTDVYQTFDMIGHKVKARRAKWIDDGWYGQDYIEGYLLAWNADGAVYVKVDKKVVRCMGDGMEFVE